MSHEIEIIQNMMNENDIVDRIYINFCNPWPKPKHKKKRLTHTRQLEHYKEFLKSGREIIHDLFDTEFYLEHKDDDIKQLLYNWKEALKINLPELWTILILSFFLIIYIHHILIIPLI